MIVVDGSGMMVVVVGDDGIGDNDSDSVCGFIVLQEVVLTAF